MMNQGGNTQTIASVDPNSNENRYVVDASQSQTSTYLPSTTGAGAVSWTTHNPDNRFTENGNLSNSTYHHEQHTEPIRNPQDGLNATPLASSSSGTTNVSQDYNGYTSYPNSSDPYGYGSTGYPGYYSSYQQQPNNTYTQPVGAYQNTGAPYQPISSFQNTGSYAGSASYSGTYYNPGDYQTAGGYPSSGYSNQTTSWNEGNYANYTSHQYSNYTADTSGTYGSGSADATSLQYQQHYKQWADYYGQTEVSCAPGTENLSVASTSNQVCPLPGVTAGHSTTNSQPPPTGVNAGYPSTNSQPPPTGVNAGYPSTNSQPPPTGAGYPSTNSQPPPTGAGYPSTNSQPPPTGAGYPSTISQPPPAGVNAGYPSTNSQPLPTGVKASTNSLPPPTGVNAGYPSTNSQPPLTGVTAGHPTTNSQPPPTSVTAGYPTINSQPPHTYTPPWQQNSSSSQMPSLQPAATINNSHDSYWKHVAPSFQNHHVSPVQPHFQKPLDTKISYDNFQDRQKVACPQVSNSQYPTVQQFSPSYQSPPLQTPPLLDNRRVSKLQIPTNPRIASNLPVGLPKTDKDISAASATAKPAYVSVSLPKANDKVLSQDAADSILKPGMFPKSLRGYVERALARCKNDTEMTACQGVLKEIITKATADGTLYTRDWDTEPLFPLPNADVVNKENLQSTTPVSSLPKYKRSPSRRTKSRWEPLPEEKPTDKLASAGSDTVKFNSWIHANEKDRKPISGNSVGKGDGLNNFKYFLSEPKSANKNVQRPVKRQRFSADVSNTADNGDASSDSDKEQSLTPYYSGAIRLANSPEERMKRESRSKRFEKGQGNRAANSHLKPKRAGAGSLYARRASALVISKNLEDSGNRAVEDIDWDALTVKGTCQEIEKRYLRLTSAPDPSTVRPEEVLEKALLMVHNSPKNYLYKCDQLKSIRQDLTVQRIWNHLTVKVYETHARLALENGDLPEYNQCQSQLKILYAEGIEGCRAEFSAYHLLCINLHSNNKRELLSSMSRLSDEAKEDKAVKHALAVRAAVTSGNYVMFFRLYKTAPNLNSCLMDLYVEKMRFKAVSCISRSYRPTVPVSYIAQVLGFSSVTPTNEGCDEKDSEGLEECVEWLKAHGALLVADSNGEMQLDAKASSSTLFMPEPEDAVAHGDASLAVNDFLTKAPVQPS